jgi:hypothetical protein
MFRGGGGCKVFTNTFTDQCPVCHSNRIDIWHLHLLSPCTHKRVPNLKEHQQLASIYWTTQMEEERDKEGQGAWTCLAIVAIKLLLLCQMVVI